MDLNGIKPNYAELGRKYGLDYRTVKKYHEGYPGEPKKEINQVSLISIRSDYTKVKNLKKYPYKCIWIPCR